MSRSVIVIGAGMGGLTAALRLARQGCRVRVIEAAGQTGGLAAGLERESFRFDAGPYLLLDRPGLEWAFRALDLDLAEHVPMQRVDDVYQVETAAGSVVRIQADLDETAAGIERSWPGAGGRYRQFVARLTRTHERLRPHLTSPHPGVRALLATGSWRDAFFLGRSLRSVMNSSGLTSPVVDALAIWTLVAGQTPARAPGALALVVAILHGVGVFLPSNGIAAVPQALERVARAAGVEFDLGTTVASVRCEGGRARGVITAEGTFREADAVLSNRNGVATYLELVRHAVPAAARRSLERLPLQSPGVCAYLAVRGGAKPPYLRFYLPGAGERCRLLVTPAAVVGGLDRDGWVPARLIAPLAHAEAERLGQAGQRAFLERILSESWWQEHVEEARVLDARTPHDWGAACHLYRQSMNPVMTSRLTRAGRLAHRSPYVSRLYLAGSSTHPGQWVSFCAISGILAADRVIEDLG
jgi:phytoene desaturase